jgi:hypothetical protein
VTNLFSVNPCEKETIQTACRKLVWWVCDEAKAKGSWRKFCSVVNGECEVKGNGKIKIPARAKSIVTITLPVEQSIIEVKGHRRALSLVKKRSGYRIELRKKSCFVIVLRGAASTDGGVVCLRVASVDGVVWYEGCLNQCQVK